MDGRMGRSQKSLIGAAMAASLVFGPVNPSKASAVAGALETTQILNNIELVAQYLQQLEDYVAQINKYRNMIENTQFQWQRLLPEEVSNVIDGVANVVRQGQSISYSMANVAQGMDIKYKGWQDFLAINYGRDTFAADYRDWTKSTQDSIAAALQGAQIQMSSFADEDNIIRQLEARAATSRGRNDVMRVTGQIATAQVHQLQKLRQLVATNMQISASFFAQENAIQSVGVMHVEKAFDRTAPGNEGPTIGGGRAHGPGD